MGKLFGTDGIRGIVNDYLTPELAYRVGLAAGEVLHRESEHKPLVFIGRDTRSSGDMLTASLASGLMASGFDVADLGIIPTPAVAFLVRKYQASFGIVVSASHNPYYYNGIKFFSSEGLKLPDEVEDAMEALILNEDHEFPLVEAKDMGTWYHGIDGYADYRDELLGRYDLDLSGLSVAVDTGNGALYKLAPEVLEKLGADVKLIHNAPNGININDECGSTKPSEVQDLVKSTGADVGISFDGDADRIIVVDELGRILDGDHILAILGQHLYEQGKLDRDTVVGTIMTNIGLDRFLNDQGMEIVKTKVGDRYVLEEMLKEGYVLGGEQSGHIIYLENNTTGDGLATGLFLLEVMKESGQKLSTLNELMISCPQVLENVEVKRELQMDYLENEKIQQAISETEDKFAGSGRVVIRPSGTEALIRVMIEGEELDVLKSEALRLVEIIKSELN